MTSCLHPRPWNEGLKLLSSGTGWSEVRSLPSTFGLGYVTFSLPDPSVLAYHEGPTLVPISWDLGED